ncbi:hypothetical protein DAEQUDRAFT_746213 [Daedalea quercina L-15889]|uniref:MYND-type domain-containing protein n=1 Tax=Daedalea quercina L-15889 TaxID=1314783 RepID=A0A165NR96_9APHY|nr:hypothetical protein DAEQUDRAFT_746213 [Daedalea quercina L-15889]
MADASQRFRCFKVAPTRSFKRCSRCRGALYCGKECQETDWPDHRELCTDSDRWYDKYRGCRDGSMHEGKLELVTWEWTDPDDGTRMGWGHTCIEEAEDLKRKFEAFRWTCCGTGADMNFGCDHHGSGSKPCTCDFCRMGKLLPDDMYNEQNGHRMGLRLRRGPDPR